MEEVFLEFYKKPVRSLTLVGVKLLNSENIVSGRSYYNFIGLFWCEALDSFIDNADELNKHSMIILNKLRTKEQISVSFRKKYTNKIHKENSDIVWHFNYVFDFSVKNIIDFQVLTDKKILELKVMGNGQF